MPAPTAPDAPNTPDEPESAPAPGGAPESAPGDAPEPESEPEEVTADNAADILAADDETPVPAPSPGPSRRGLLIGGGVGVAPLLYFGKKIREFGARPTFLLGARSAKDLLELDEFDRYGEVCVTTEDGSFGEQGFVTGHSVLSSRFDRISTCGPKPMMVSVARYARRAGIECEASLENMMACGLGACLCCVEKTTEGNLCVCKEGPVFNIRRLLW